MEKFSLFLNTHPGGRYDIGVFEIDMVVRNNVSESSEIRNKVMFVCQIVVGKGTG
jgi:hypothetical protein